jgi:predicted ATPase/DNA-binding XRE family transcriptional regulator
MAEIYSFGYWVLRRRKALDLTREELATRVGCAPETIKKIERDERRPSRQIAELLANALGVLPEEYEHFLQSARGDRSVHGLPLLSQSLSLFAPPHNLPSQPTSFIGREKEIETVERLLISGGEGRLLTLTGAGGSGKTRLALEVAARLRDEFPDGVWFIEFAPLTDTALVLQSVLTTLGLGEQAGRSPISIVSDFLQPRRVLLILDNCEHLIQSCAQLVETLLRACPALHILATSREALSIAGEALYLVPTLSIPDPAQADLATLPQYEAVQLFVARAQTALPGFALTANNTSAVAQVCHQLDGIPLAIELAAARVKALRVEQIAARLAEHDQFHLLTAGSRTSLPRHQTLNALIDWSHDLLVESERVLFRRLAVFAGGWTLEAAEGVCVGDVVESDNVLDLITQLVNKSLVIGEREQGREARYRMLETIHQYASERLLEAGEGEQVRKRHFEFFLQLAEQAEPYVRGPQLPAYLNGLEAEHDNMRAALEWSLSQADYGEARLRLAGALFSFWEQRGYISEGRAWLARTITNTAAPSAGAARAKALYGAGCLAGVDGGSVEAKTLLEQSVKLWRALGSAGLIGLAHTLSILGQITRNLGDPAASRVLINEAIILFRAQDERWGLAWALSYMGMTVRDQEDFVLASSFVEESITLWRELGNPLGLGSAIRVRGNIAMRQGDNELAQRAFAESLAITRKLGNKNVIANSLIDLCQATLCLDDRIQAKTYIQESYDLIRESGNKAWLVDCFYYFGLLAGFEGDNQQARIFLEQVLLLARQDGSSWQCANALMGLAGVAAADGRALRAAKLLGAADTQIKAGASYWDGAESRYIQRAVTSAVAQLGESVFAKARAEGRAMNLEQAADYALGAEPSG